MMSWPQDWDDFAVQCRGLVNRRFFAVEMKEEVCVQEQVRAGNCRAGKDLVREDLEMSQVTVSVHSGDRNEMAEPKNGWV